MPRLLAALALLLLAPAGAHAGTLAEAPPLDASGGTSCVGPTGTPGEVALGTETGVRFYAATRTGFQRRQAVKLGARFSCDSVRTLPGGAGLIVGDNGNGTVAAVRDPGGAWSDPIDLSGTGGQVTGLAAAVSERGDAVVAFRETAISASGAGASRLYVARRAPGAAGFVPAEQLGTAAKGLGRFQVGVSAAGEVVAVTTARERGGIGLSASIAAPGGSFAPPVRLGTTSVLADPALDVAADGRALIAFTEGGQVRLAERAPGQPFGAAGVLGPAGGDAVVAVSATQGAGGAAAVAWQTAQAPATRVAARAAVGPFATPTPIDAETPVPHGFDPFYFSESYFSALGGLGGGVTFIDDLHGSIALTRDGRIAVGTSGGGDAPFAQLSTVPLAGGAATVARTPTLAAGDFNAAPLILADGTPALLWLDRQQDLISSFLDGPFRLRLAAEGLSTPADPPAPKVTIGAPVRRTLRGEAALRLPVTCSAACDVSVTAEERIGSVTLTGAVRLRRAGRRTVAIDGAGFLVGRKATPVRLRVVYGARGALYPKRRTMTVRLRHTGPARPRITSVRARRDGDRIRVEVAASGDVEDLLLLVSGDDTGGWNGEPLVTRTVEVKPDGTARLSLPARAGLNYVAARMPIYFGPGSKKVTRVR